MQVLWSICTALVLQAADAPAASPAPPVSDATASTSGGRLNAAQQVAPAIQDSIRTNSERLEGVELALTRTLINAGVDKEEVVETPLPNGGKVTTKKVPHHTFAERVVLMNDLIRVDQGGVGNVPAVTYWFDGIRWTELNTSARRVSKMHESQIGGLVLDPRESVGIDHRSSLATILSQAALETATVESVDSVTRIATTANPGGQKLIVDFDSRYAMLPTRSQLFHPNGTIARDVDIKYAWMEPRSAWTLEGVTERVYDEAVDGLAAPHNWKQQLITMMTCTLLERDAARKLLTPLEPDGFKVVDHTSPATKKPMAKPSSVGQATAESPLKWFIIAHLVVAAFAAAYFWRRRSASAV